MHTELPQGGSFFVDKLRFAMYYYLNTIKGGSHEKSL